jgi:ATP-binding cassette subfamily B (MDR/TAP) protein 1
MGAEGENIDHTMQSQEEDASAGLAIHNRASSRESSSSDGLGVEHEKAMAGQAAMPVQMANPGIVNPLTKLDSKVVDVKSEEEDPFAHLPAHEADILRLQINVPPVTTGYFALYRYATRNDWIIFGISCLCTIAAGAAMPLMTARISPPYMLLHH